MTWRSVLAVAVLWPASAQILLNPPREASVITVDVSLVNVLCTVRDRGGGYVKDLAKEDFEVQEDGRRAEISHFAREVDTPLTVALLLDVSGSVARLIDSEKATAGRFFAQVLRPIDQALLVGFAHMIAVWQDFTSSAADLETALDSAGPFLIQPRTRTHGGTLLYDAVNLVATRKLGRRPGRKTMILITDGRDNGSLVKLDMAVKAAQQADAVVYAIHDKDASWNEKNGVGPLEKLSRPTGGRTFQLGKKTPLDAIFAAIRDEMRSQYGIGFRPANQDGAFHKLEVRTRRPDLKVQARTGYYALKK